MLRRCIRTILTRLPGSDDTVPLTYEGIYNTCRSVIMVSHLEDELYSVLRIELERSIGRLSKALMESTETETKWITSFNKALKWLDDQIVSFKSQYRLNAKSHKWFTELTSVTIDLSRPISFKRCFAYSVSLFFWPVLENHLFLSLYYSDFSYLLVNDQIFGDPQIAERLRTAVKDWLNGERRKG